MEEGDSFLEELLAHDLLNSIEILPRGMTADGDRSSRARLGSDVARSLCCPTE
jgi:hypothetical protein